LNNAAWSAFQSEKPQVVWREPSDSRRSYRRARDARDAAFPAKPSRDGTQAGAPPRFVSLIWNDQTTLTEAAPVHPAKTPSRPCRFIPRFSKGRTGAIDWLDVHSLLPKEKAVCGPGPQTAWVQASDRFR
jgi:hypothetical protein